MSHDYLKKLLLLGPASAGKSAILSRYADNTFTHTYISTIGVDFKTSAVNHKGKRVKLQIWDTAGQERFRSITANYHRGADGCFLVFDLTSLESFNMLPNFVEDLVRYGPEKPNVVVVGAKSDLVIQETVPAAEIKKFCETRGWPYIEVSANTEYNIINMFTMMLNLIFGPQRPYFDPRITVSAPAPLLKITLIEQAAGSEQEWVDNLVNKEKDKEQQSSAKKSSAKNSSVQTSSSTTPDEVKIEEEAMSGRLLDQRDFDLHVFASHLDLPASFVPKIIAKATASMRQGFQQYTGNTVPRSFEELKLGKDDYPAIGLTCCVHDPADPAICELFTNNELGLLAKNFITFECVLKPSYMDSTYFYSGQQLLIGPAGLNTSLWDIINSYLTTYEIEDLYVRFYSYEEGQHMGRSKQIAACELKGLKSKLTPTTKLCVRFRQDCVSSEADRLTLIVSHSAFLVCRGSKNVEVRFSQYPSVCVIHLPTLRLVMCVEQGKLAGPISTSSSSWMAL